MRCKYVTCVQTFVFVIITYSVFGAGKRGPCLKYENKVLELSKLLSFYFYGMICKLVYTEVKI